VPASAIAIAGLIALAVAMGVGRFAFTPILPMMQDDAGLTISGGGWLAVANYVGYLVGALTAIRLPFPPAKIIRGGLLLTSLATLAMGLHDSFGYWLVLRAAAGVTSAWVLIFVSVWALEKQASGGMLYAGVGSGIVAAGAVCLALMAMHASSSAAWITLGVVSTIVTAALWRVFESGPGAAIAPGGSHGGPNNWLFILCYSGYGFGYIIPATFLPAMARHVISDPLLFGWVWPVFGATAVASTLFAGLFRNQRNVWTAATLIMAFGVAAPLAIPGLSGILVSAILVGSTFVVITMAGMQEARRVARAHAHKLMAAMTSGFALGQILGPLCVGYKTSVAQTLLAATAVLVLSAAGLFFDGLKTNGPRSTH
jgi:predicted MFS family arabinose efflux permease